MDPTRTNQNRTTTRSSYLPNITSSQTMSYAQRYQHMTKIANYNEMNQSQIWKQYQKLRICLKQLNQQVLYHMQKKAQNNLYAKQTPVPPTVQATLLLLDQQRKTNQSRLQIYLNQGTILQQRVDHLANKTQYLQDINNQIQLSQAKIRQLIIQNKEMKRKQKLASKDLLTGPQFLQKLVIQQQALYYAKRKYDKYDQILKQALAKISQFNQKTAQYQSILLNRVNQYKQKQGYIVQQINLQKFQQLQNTKNNVLKYQNVYKRNYLMKLKQLENLVNSNNKHQQVITQTEANNKAMRMEIDQISAIVVKNNNNRRRSSLSMLQHDNAGSKTGRKSIALDNSINNTIFIRQNEGKITSANDKNRPTPMKF